MKRSNPVEEGRNEKERRLNSDNDDNKQNESNSNIDGLLSTIPSNHDIVVVSNKQTPDYSWVPDQELWVHDMNGMESFLKEILPLYSIAGELDHYIFGYTTYSIYQSGLKQGKKKVDMKNFTVLPKYEIPYKFDWEQENLCFVLKQKSKDDIKDLKAQASTNTNSNHNGSSVDNNKCKSSSKSKSNSDKHNGSSNNNDETTKTEKTEMDKINKKLKKYSQIRNDIQNKSILPGVSCVFSSNNSQNNIKNEIKAMIENDWHSWLETEADNECKIFFKNNKLQPFHEAQIWHQRVENGTDWSEIARVVRNSISNEAKLAGTYKMSKTNNKSKKKKKENKSKTKSNNDSDDGSVSSDEESRVAALETQLAQLKEKLKQCDAMNKGYMSMGVNPMNMDMNRIGMGMNSMGANGMGANGMGASGMGMSGVDMSGMGMSRMGMNHMGMNPMSMGINTMGMGINPMGINPMGMNHMGMNHMGMTHMGMNHMGMSHMGMSPRNMNSMGMNDMSMNSMGMHRMGINSMNKTDINSMNSSNLNPLGGGMGTSISSMGNSTLPMSALNMSTNPIGGGTDNSLKSSDNKYDSNSNNMTFLGGIGMPGTSINGVSSMIENDNKFNNGVTGFNNVSNSDTQDIPPSVINNGNLPVMPNFDPPNTKPKQQSSSNMLKYMPNLNKQFE